MLAMILVVALAAAFEHHRPHCATHPHGADHVNLKEGARRGRVPLGLDLERGSGGRIRHQQRHAPVGGEPHAVAAIE